MAAGTRPRVADVVVVAVGKETKEVMKCVQWWMAAGKRGKKAWNCSNSYIRLVSARRMK
jgi:hypothetical protein